MVLNREYKDKTVYKKVPEKKTALFCDDKTEFLPICVDETLSPLLS